MDCPDGFKLTCHASEGLQISISVWNCVFVQDISYIDATKTTVAQNLISYGVSIICTHSEN